MVERSDSSITSDLLILLKSCADLARTLDKDTAGTQSVLNDLIAKIQSHHGNPEAVAPGFVDDAAIRAIQTGPEAGRLYLVMLPPISGPKFEDCPKCYGRRVQGTNKQ